jgi:hypothetical protein
MLTDTAIRAAKPREKSYKLFDGLGLYLEVPRPPRQVASCGVDRVRSRQRQAIVAHSHRENEDARATLVPLAKQAVVLLRELRSVTGRGQHVFPSLRSGSRPISENTVNAALRRMGYTTEEMTGHGFRSLASTCLNEQGYHPDLIELQLAHAERNQVRAAYNKAQRLPERRKMMQARGGSRWAARRREGGAHQANDWLIRDIRHYPN